MNILEAHNISKAFTNHVALNDVSIDVPQGCVYGLLGPNGAGKTTLIRIINHITAPDSGTVMFDGKPLTANDIVNIGYLPEERGLYKKMKVGEQAIFFAQLKGMSRSEATTRLKEWFKRLEIENWWNKKIEELSKGMAQKVQFIITVLHRPKLLIFDEPFSGFDPINANILKREILRLRDEGATVIFSTHNMSSVEELCDNITLINNSRNILTGNVSQLRRDFAGKNVRLTFNGDVETLTSAISNMALVTDNCSEEKNIYDQNSHAIVVDLFDGVSRRDLIAAANSAVDLISFEPMLPSMDNIFIKAVNAASNR
jgi:ABC-2 type transport system ATP-binding protein